MSLEALKKDVCTANRDLQRHGLAVFSFGNVSAIDRSRGVIIIKPSGVPYEHLTPENMVLADLEGKVLEGKLRPSSDTPTHLRLYEAFPHIGAVVHTHSVWATAFAQAGIPIECFGTTHADYFQGAIPCTRALTEAEISGDYERETGTVIAEAFRGAEAASTAADAHKPCPIAIPAVLVKHHGPFTWGVDASDAVFNAQVLEYVAQLVTISYRLNPQTAPIPNALLDKHYLRKHGAGAYYGQG